MTDTDHAREVAERSAEVAKDAPDVSKSDVRQIDSGGLRFTVTFRASRGGEGGATLRVRGDVGGQDTELLRFDDFVLDPHFHVPAAGDQIAFDRATGEALDFYISQIRDELPALLRQGGFDELASSVDMADVAAHAESLRQAMIDCVPDGFVREPGWGLRPRRAHLT